jgi:hypothetical protein
MEEFKRYGEVLDLQIKRKDNKSNYHGYVIMRSKSAAEKAFHQISKEYIIFNLVLDGK